jgi:hypothetical protein
MKCPNKICSQDIDDDSRYCDQCGEQLLVCSLCGRPGKGKRCVLDGNELVPIGSGSQAAPTTVSISTQAPQSVQTSQPPSPAPTNQATQSPSHVTSGQIPPVAAPIQQAPIHAPVKPINQNVGDKITLTSQMHGITLDVKDGDIIGRKNGPFAEIFNRFNYISGTHCKFVKNSIGWHIQDLGSTNKTFYNGNQLDPNTLYSVLNNTTIKIADIELLVTYDTEQGGTSRL